MSEAFKNSVQIEPCANGSFIVTLDYIYNSPKIGTRIAFTNRADLLAWITGELAPTPTKQPLTIIGEDNWTPFNDHCDTRPEGTVDVIYQNELMVKNCDTITVNWSDVTHWRHVEHITSSTFLDWIKCGVGAPPHPRGNEVVDVKYFNCIGITFSRPAKNVNWDAVEYWRKSVATIK